MPGSEEIPYTLSIRQGKQTIEITEGEQVISLQPQDFSFLVELRDVEGVYLSASFNDYYYRLGEHEQIKDWKYIKAKVMVEKSFNEEKELLVDDESLSYWFYDPKLDWHRFDKRVKSKHGVVKASKKVDRLYDVDAKANVELTDCSDTLFLFFFHIEEDEKGEPVTATFRKKAIVVFRD